MVRFKVPAVRKDYADGSQAIRMLDDGSGFCFYKSGRIAISVTSTDLGFIQLCYDDNKAGTVLMHFDEIGCASSCSVPSVSCPQLTARCAQDWLRNAPPTAGRHDRAPTLRL